MWAMRITGHSICHGLPCPVPSWVPNTIGNGVAIQLNSVQSTIAGVNSKGSEVGKFNCKSNS